MILDLALDIAVASFAIALILNLWRLLSAPTVPDRILAVDTMTVNVIALLTLYAAKIGSPIHFEAVILLAMLGFIATIAYCRYLLRGSIIE
jgi:multicomponent K+:H+ antiporter subunit F